MQSALVDSLMHALRIFISIWSDLLSVTVPPRGFLERMQQIEK